MTWTALAPLTPDECVVTQGKVDVMAGRRRLVSFGVFVGAALAVAGAVALGAPDDGAREVAEKGGEPKPYVAADAPPPFQSPADLASVSRLVVEADIEGPSEFRKSSAEERGASYAEMVGSQLYRARVTEVIASAPEVQVEVGQVIEVAMFAANPSIEEPGFAEDIRAYSTPLENTSMVLFLDTNTNPVLEGVFSVIGSDLGSFTVEGDELTYRGYGPMSKAPLRRADLVAAVQQEGALGVALNRQEPTGTLPPPIPEDAPPSIPMTEPRPAGSEPAPAG